MASWRDKFTFQSKRYVDHSVGDRQFRFYPNHMDLLEELKEVSKPLAAAWTVLTSDTRMDLSSSIESQTDKDGSKYERQSYDAVGREMAEFRTRQRAEAVQEAMDSLGDPRLRLLIGKLLMDSLRDDFSRSEARDPRLVEEFVNGSDEFEGLTLATMVDMLKGWLQANAIVFGETGKKLQAAMAAHLESATESETSTSDGSTSKTPSSSPSAAASASTGS